VHSGPVQDARRCRHFGHYLIVFDRMTGEMGTIAKDGTLGGDDAARGGDASSRAYEVSMFVSIIVEQSKSSQSLSDANGGNKSLFDSRGGAGTMDLAPPGSPSLSLRPNHEGQS
jgi:hypothetical protein